ncbi:MAG: PD-(D/E)XK nuclease family protein, partial [Spirochaetales bacterium]|nr:PD-(D/E)XK nuclease family protein [Spirochaetales bacterium]
DIPMQDLMEELGEVHGIDFLVKQEPEKASFEHFFTQEAEIETLFNRLEELKIQGVSTDDIIISTPDIDTLASRLERKAQEYDTPLSFMQSLSLKETVPGRYLYALERCINEDLSFRSLENLLLNNALPFRDPQLCRRLVDFMVEHNVRTGTLSFTSRDRLLLELKASGEKETGEFYEALKKDLSAVRSACDGETLVRDMHRLAGLLFGEAEFSASEAVDRDVYSFVFNELSTMGRTLSECRLQMKGIFSVFMAELEDMSYVLQEKRTGIRVYRYGQDHLIDVPYHFVIGLSDSNCTLASSPMSFLEDHEISERRVHDITEAVLGYYSSLSAHVHISGSATSYDGAQSVPTFFLERNLVVPMRPSFPELFSRADAASLEQARMTALAPRGSDLARTGHGEKVDVSTEKLSYSAISGYVQCPYRAYLGRGMTKDAPDRFEPVMQDDAEMGTFLHSVVQTFMGRHLNTLLVPQELETYQDEMAQVMDDMLGENHVFDYYTKLSLRACYLEPLQDILALLLLPNGKRKGYVGPFMPLSNEYRLKSDPQFTGYVDTIIRNEDGEIFLLDYKKGKADPTYQLILYKRLYDKDPQFGDDVKDCFFYSMKDSVFKGFDAAKWVEQSLRLDEDLERVREGYASGDWAATPDRLTCEGCAERAICRRRFNLQ